MTTLDEIIKKEINPFDPVSFKTGNFWTEDKPASSSTVDSIHQEAIVQISDILNLVSRDYYTRTILLTGDSGCGKTYLLGRLKKNLNSQAFFAYIDPSPTSDCIWRHTLRYTVDSLMYTPEGEKETQLLLWLKGLSAFSDRGLRRKILGEKRLFISNLRNTFPAGIFQPKDFFGVLYELTNKDNYLLACDWLRGENLDKDDLKALGVNSVIETEAAARGILGNIGRISRANKPIVLCFDQVELAPKLQDGSFDISPVFNVNTTFHNNNLKNFVVIISITTDKWMDYKQTIPLSDLARIAKFVLLKHINLEQVEALWADRLEPLHRQVNPKPKSHIEPLERNKLEQKYRGGKANLRDSLNFGGKLFLGAKTGKSVDGEHKEILAAFKLLWHQELKTTQEYTTRIRQFSSQELIQMLQQAMKALEVKKIKPQLLSGKYASYSFSYQLPGKTEKVGILWNEDPSLTAFCNGMKACDKAMKQNICSSLILIRAESLGKPKNKGYQLFKKIFTVPSHYIKPTLDSIHYLKTYQRLVKAALAGDLTVGFETPELPELQKLIRDSQVLNECSLLQDLEIVREPIVIDKKEPEGKPNPKQQKVKEFLFNIVKIHKLLGVQTLNKQAAAAFSYVNELQINKLIKELCQENKISILDPKAKPEKQLVCLVPQG